MDEIEYFLNADSLGESDELEQDVIYVIRTRKLMMYILFYILILIAVATIILNI